MANVFGVKVPKSEGRAGMVAFNCELQEFKWDNFSNFVSEKLPSYAQPVFVRIIEELETTGTFKLKKKIRYRSEYRGIKEMDILLGSFVKKYINLLESGGSKDYKSLFRPVYTHVEISKW